MYVLNGGICLNGDVDEGMTRVMFSNICGRGSNTGYKNTHTYAWGLIELPSTCYFNTPCYM